MSEVISKENLQVTIEHLIDNYGLEHVLRSAANICDTKADSIACHNAHIASMLAVVAAALNRIVPLTSDL